MRRKGRKSQQNANEVKTESSKRSTRQSSRRRKRSLSRSSEENAVQDENLKQNPEIVQPDQIEEQIESEINDSGNKPIDESEKIEIQEENEAKDEEDTKGKSTGINNTNNDQTWNNIEPENENVQRSSPSPKDKEENIENSKEKEIQITNETPCIIEETTVTNENQKNGEEEEPNSNENEKEKDNQSPKQQGDTFESEYAKEKSPVNAHDEPIERSHTPELKKDDKPEKKRITLKRLPSEKPKPKRSASPLEDGEIQEPKEKSRKITLKRRTTEESHSDIDKIIINRRSSAGDDKNEKRKRLISVTEENTLTVVGKPNKPSKTVKLVRNFSRELSQNSETSQPIRRQIWGKSEFLDNLTANTYKIDMDSIKIVCPSVEFLKESEVKLEEVPSNSESEVGGSKEDEEGKSEEEIEKDQTEEDDSSEEQKIVANPNIIALNRKISIVEDTAAKMRPPPSPAKNPPSEILFITNLVRPFTIKQLKELLERTGKIKDDGFWTDRIKSKCYAYYESVNEAEATRNALHGVYWPIGNGKQLNIDYATESDMENAKNPVPLPTVIEKLPDKENRVPELLVTRHKEKEVEREHDKEERRRDTSGREWDKSKQEQRRRHSRSKSRSRERARKHSRRSYTPEDNRKKYKSVDDSVPQKLMDDLFLKTKAMPSIYWQPLSPQEIATKQQQRLVRMEEHKRRIEENKGRRDRDRRGSFRRR